MTKMRVMLLALFLGAASLAPLVPSLAQVGAPAVGEAEAQLRRRRVVVRSRPTVVVRTGPRVYVRRSYGTYYGVGGLIALLIVIGIIGYFMGWWGGYVVVDSPVVVDPGVVVVDSPVIVADCGGVIVDADCSVDCSYDCDADCSDCSDCGGGDW